MHLFFAQDIIDNYYTLSGDEAIHCSRVLRLHEKDIIYLTDGHGKLYKGIIDFISQKECNVMISDIIKHEKKNPVIHMAVSLTKNMERFECFLEKATEIGVDIITPLICVRTEKRKINFDRCQKIIVSALKQSFRVFLPDLKTITAFENFLQQADEPVKMIAVCAGTDRKTIKNVYKAGEDALIMIGPEGDFTEEEITMALNKNFFPVSLGNSRLRTETAAITACHALNFINER